MSGSVVLSASRQTDRISHNCRIDKHDSQALLGATLGALTCAAGSGGVVSSQVGAGTCSAGGRGTMAIELRELIPNTTSGKVEEGSPDTFLGQDMLPAAVAGAQKVSCDHHKDKPIKMGSTTVFVNKKRLSRQTDETECGAQLCDGELTVLVGGEPTDEAPEDPLTKLTEGAVVALSALGAALTAGADAVETALSYGQVLVEKVAGVAEQGIESAMVVEGEIAASIGSLLGSVEGAILGPTYGQKIGDKGK